MPSKISNGVPTDGRRGGRFSNRMELLCIVIVLGRSVEVTAKTAACRLGSRLTISSSAEAVKEGPLAVKKSVGVLLRSSGIGSGLMQAT